MNLAIPSSFLACYSMHFCFRLLVMSVNKYSSFQMIGVFVSLNALRFLDNTVNCSRVAAYVPTRAPKFLLGPAATTISYMNSIGKDFIVRLYTYHLSFYATSNMSMTSRYSWFLHIITLFTSKSLLVASKITATSA